MSMYSLLREKPETSLSAQEIESRFDGNICRCTGYRAIMTAMSTFASESSQNYSEDINGLPEKRFEVYDPRCEPQDPPIKAFPSGTIRMQAPDGSEWVKVGSIQEIAALQAGDCKIVAGHTSVGVYPDIPHERGTGNPKPTRYIDISGLPELRCTDLTSSHLVVGAAVSISSLESLLREHKESSESSFVSLADHIRLIGNWQVRNAGSWAGNLVMTKKFGFASDLSTILMAADAELQLVTPTTGKESSYSVAQFLDPTFHFSDELIVNMRIPFCAPREKLLTFRQALRSTNAHALLNAGLRATIGADNTIEKCSLVLGAASAQGPISIPAVESYLTGKALDTATLQGVLAIIRQVELHPEMQYHTTMQPEGKDKYRAGLLESIMLMFLTQLTNSDNESPGDPRSALKHRPAGSGSQLWLTNLPDDHPGKYPTTKPDAVQLASGECKFANDTPPTFGTLYGAAVPCLRAPAKIVKIPSETALSMPGVNHFVDATALAGNFDNGQAAFVRGEEPLVAPIGSTTLYVGQIVAIVLANTRREAEEAAAVAAHEVIYEDVPGSTGVYGIDQVVAISESSETPSTDQHIVLPAFKDLVSAWHHAGVENDGNTVYGEVRLGETNPNGTAGCELKGIADSVWDRCATVVEGECLLGGQSHFTIERQTTTCIPEEGGRYVVIASTQQPDDTHIRAAATLGLGKDKVTVRNKRVGGGFGSKCTRSYFNSCAAILCARISGATVKIQNSIGTDMHFMGNCRDPMLVKFKAGCDAQGLLQGVDVWTAVDSGCTTDYSDFVAEEVMYNVEGSYLIPNFRNKVCVNRTNTASNTAFRGPGLVEAAAIGEHIVEAVAAKHGDDPVDFRLKNLMTAENNKTCLEAKTELEQRKAAIDEYNSTHKWTKRGIGLMPLRFAHTHGFSQGQSALVNISASDGSVSAWTTGCEIGQGLFTKVTGAIAQKFGIDASTVSVMEVNTQVTPNGMITGGSTTSECCVSAAEMACDMLLERLAPVRQHMADKNGKQPTWRELCAFSNTAEPLCGISDHPLNGLTSEYDGGGGAGLFTPDAMHVNLSAAATHQPRGRTPQDILAGKSVGIGHGITDYFSTGASVTEVEIDLLTGVKTINRATLVQDCGHSLNPQIDIGQAEGGFVIGLGFYLQEEVMIDPNTGHNNSHDTWEYKPCLNRDIPIEFNVELLPDSPFGLELAVRGSKAIGEPPVLLALSAFSAVRYAIAASRKERGLSPEFQLEMPATVDRIHQALELDSSVWQLGN